MLGQGYGPHSCDIADPKNRRADPSGSEPDSAGPDHLQQRLAAGRMQPAFFRNVGDIDDFIAARVEQARAFEPHYMERTRANGRTISVEGAPLPQGGWVTVYTDISAEKAQEELLRARSEVLSDQVLAAFRRTGRHKPPTCRQHQSHRRGPARHRRDGGPHPPDNRNDASPHCPCRCGWPLYIFKPSAERR
ncbi:hypothetical protein GQR58_000218 [Nymphon striatum]|nr:hypothetical protein GQR58_000218 [Nymphon striatum]